VIRPTADRIVVVMDAPATESASGLVFGNPVPQLTGTVQAVGPGARCPSCGKGKPLLIHPGDVVVLGPGTPVHEVTVDGQTYTLLREADVLAILPQEQSA
jgi:co-chaperonin GroES (HSP10)